VVNVGSVPFCFCTNLCNWGNVVLQMLALAESISYIISIDRQPTVLEQLGVSKIHSANRDYSYYDKEVKDISFTGFS